MDAKIGEVEEFKDRKIKELNADKEHHLAKYRNDAQIARAQHDFNLKKAEFDISISQERAKSDLANELQEEIGSKSLIKENFQIELERDFNFESINEKKKEIKKLELDCKIKQLADSEFEKAKLISDAEQIKIVKEGDTESEIIKIIGEAEAYRLEKVSKAYCEIMSLEASAYSDFNQAAKINMLLDTLPKVSVHCSFEIKKLIFNEQCCIVF